MQNISGLATHDVQLIDIAARHAKERFKEGLISIAAALRTKNGTIYTGINLKYRVRNVCTCAEIMAVYNALNQGETDLDTIVGVKYFPQTDSYEVVNGCGTCRQLFAYNTPLTVITDKNGTLEIVRAEALLPFAFL